MTDEILTIGQLARRYRVEETIIRGWIKRGAINYDLVDGRHVRMKKSDVVKPIVPVAVVPVTPLEPKGEDHVGEGAADQVLDRGKDEGVRRNEETTRRTALDEEIARRRRGTAAGTGSSTGRG